MSSFNQKGSCDAAVFCTQPRVKMITARNSGRLNYHKENIRKLTLGTTRGSLIFH